MIIYNNLIPFKGFKAITFGIFIFARTPLNVKDINHEYIHSKQQLEMLYIPFFIIYIIEYLYNLIKYMNINKAYRNISFEKEAYSNESNLSYLNTRPKYNFIHYI